MRVPLSWLAEFIPIEEPPEVLAERLTTGGLEVEDIERVGEELAGVVVGRLEAVRPHPAGERLVVCTVAAGGEAAVQVVTQRAAGVRPGACVLLARPGTDLPSGRRVESVEVGGVRSDGLLCAEVDLGLAAASENICLLPGEAAPGSPAASALGLADVVLVVAVPPNRGDCLSVLGIAREVGALAGRQVRVRMPRLSESGPPMAGRVTLSVAAPRLCPRYAARLVEGIKIGPSPLWLRQRLVRAGLKPVSNVVDATNYVMIERGQPLHAFDLSALAGGAITVREAHADERITTLDGVERVLGGGDLLICDARRPVALAGVMGGAETEVRPTTTAVLLESACFAAATVRRTARRLGLSTEAAYRFGRGVDPEGVPPALDRVAELIHRLAGGRVARGRVEAYPGRPAAPVSIRLRPEHAEALLGISLPRAEVRRRLVAIGARCRAAGREMVVTPPSFRADLRMEEDLVEELARLGGYEAIPPVLPRASVQGGEEGETWRLGARVRSLLAARGLCEMVTLALTDSRTNALLPGFVGRGLRPLALRNPLSSEASELRLSPLAGLMLALRHNRKRGASFVAAFTLGKGYGLGPEAPPVERLALSVLLWGAWPPRGVERSGPRLDAGDLRGVADALFAFLGVEGKVRWRPTSEVGFLHPGKAALLAVGESVLGVAGALHPDVTARLDLPEEPWVFELDLLDTLNYLPRRVRPRPLPRFPAVSRDIAIVVDERFLADEIIEGLRELDEPLLEEARLFDVYRGAPIPPGKKSLAYSVAYRAPGRSLTDDEVNAAHDRVTRYILARHPAELRS